MKLAHTNPAVKNLANTFIFIALTSLQTWTTAQNVYKCGHSYSQTPCPGGLTVNVEDTRTAAQKKQTENAVKMDAKEAQTLEKSRTSQEKAAMKQQPVAAPTAALAAPQITPAGESGVVHKITPKRFNPKHNKPEAFVAEVPGSEKKKVAKKTAKKKVAQKAASPSA